MGFCSLGVVAILVVLLASVLAAAPASASKRIAFVSMRAKVDGYHFDVGTRIGAGSNPAGVGFFRDDRNGDVQTAAFYRVAGAGSYADRRMNLDLGPFGSARARFIVEDERRHVRHHGEHCAEVEIRRTGRFEGEIDVQGENGFAAVHRSTIRGRVESYRIRGCRQHRALKTVGPAPAISSFRPRSLFRARSIRHPAVSACGTDRDTWFFAGRGFGEAPYGASFETRGGGIHALRLSFSLGSPSSFELSPDERRVLIKPDADYFSGTGRYSKHRLSGDIAADFPGRPDVPMAPATAELGDVDEIAPGPCYPFGGD
ncbi:MAG: hypothetical protein U0R51_10115 [Solirubrobacterales bacterium]